MKSVSPFLFVGSVQGTVECLESGLKPAAALPSRDPSCTDSMPGKAKLLQVEAGQCIVRPQVTGRDNLVHRDSSTKGWRSAEGMHVMSLHSHSWRV